MRTESHFIRRGKGTSPRFLVFWIFVWILSGAISTVVGLKKTDFSRSFFIREKVEKESALDFLCFLKSFECIRIAYDKREFRKPASFHVHSMFWNPPPQNPPIASGSPCSGVTMKKLNQPARQSQLERRRNKGEWIRDKWG